MPAWLYVLPVLLFLIAIGSIVMWRLPKINRSAWNAVSNLLILGSLSLIVISVVMLLEERQATKVQLATSPNSTSSPSDNSFGPQRPHAIRFTEGVMDCKAGEESQMVTVIGNVNWKLPPGIPYELVVNRGDTSERRFRSDGHDDLQLPSGVRTLVFIPTIDCQIEITRRE